MMVIYYNIVTKKYLVEYYTIKIKKQKYKVVAKQKQILCGN